MAPKRPVDPKVEVGLELLRSGACTEVAKAAKQAGCVRRTLSDWWNAEQSGDSEDQPGMQERPDGSIIVVSNPNENTEVEPEELMAKHGIDLAEWTIARVRANSWGALTSDKASGDNRIVTLHQLRVEAVPNRLLIQVPDPSDWKPPPKPKRRKPTKDRPRKVVICGDHHCPHEDRTLHALFLEFLEDEKPDEGVILGDLMDFSSISRHRRGKKAEPPDVNACLRAAQSVLLDYRHASPDTTWTLLPGNHDDRLDHIQIDNTPGAYEIKPGGGEDLEGNETQNALSLRELLFLDLLGIDTIFEDFNRAKYLLGRKITLRHGYLTGKNASQRMLDKITHSTVFGHTHRLRLVYKTEHDEHDPECPTTTRLAAEAGCMAEIKDSLYYGDEEDWQQGFLLAFLYPDDDFTLAPVPYVPGRLLAPSGKRYAA